MSEITGIAWTNSSWNPWIGCTEVSPGCDNCYARALDKRYMWGGATHWGAGVARHHTKNWNAPLTWNRKAAATGKRWTVFPSLCDPFDNEVKPAWRADLFGLIHATPNLTWLLLTKRIGNAAKLMPPYKRRRVDRDGKVTMATPGTGVWPNVWLGASVVNQEEADRDIPKLLATPAAKRFVSYEPALWPVDFGEFLRSYDVRSGRSVNALDWIIVGGESSQGGAKARPFDLAWARSTRNQCKAAGVPCFFKQAGSNVCDSTRGENPFPMFKDRAGADQAEWPEDLRVMEFPT